MENTIWKGAFISEGLEDPRILNDFTCYKFRITSDKLPLDDKGTTGRWHMFWIEAKPENFEIFAENMKYNWYGHFWKDNDIVAVFQGRMFNLIKDDKSTWKEAIEFGLSQNIEEEQLDFLTD